MGVDLANNLPVALLSIVERTSAEAKPLDSSKSVLTLSCATLYISSTLFLSSDAMVASAKRISVCSSDENYHAKSFSTSNEMV